MLFLFLSDKTHIASELSPRLPIVLVEGIFDTHHRMFRAELPVNLRERCTVKAGFAIVRGLLGSKGEIF